MWQEMQFKVVECFKVHSIDCDRLQPQGFKGFKEQSDGKPLQRGILNFIKTASHLSVIATNSADLKIQMIMFAKQF